MLTQAVKSLSSRRDLPPFDITSQPVRGRLDFHFNQHRPRLGYRSSPFCDEPSGAWSPGVLRSNKYRRSTLCARKHTTDDTILFIGPFAETR